MSEIWVAIIASAAALTGSFLTSFFTYLFSRRQQKRDYELKWIEERFNPAIEFMGRVFSLVNCLSFNTNKEHNRIIDKIQDYIISSVKENNVWYIAIHLDPENTGLRDIIFSTMRYAKIEENPQKLTEYQGLLHLNLAQLAIEYQRERHLVMKGKSLAKIIENRKKDIDRSTNELTETLKIFRDFLNGKIELNKLISKIKKGKHDNLKWIFNILESDQDETKINRLNNARIEIKKRGWI